MSINFSQFENNLQIIANNVSVTSNTSDFLNIAKAIQFVESGQVESYSSFSSFPDAASKKHTFVLDESTNFVYFSNGNSWILAFSNYIVKNDISSPANNTAICTKFTKTINDVATTALALAENSYGGNFFVTGYNRSGELGDGTTTNYSSPIQVGTLTNWKQVAFGFSNQLGIKTDGTLWTCGYNYHGNLGNGTTTNYSSPIQVGSLTNWKQVASSMSGWPTIFAAIKTDGTLWTCGYNPYGQLGNGVFGDGTGNKWTGYSSPIQVGTLTNWKQVSCGYGHTASIKTDGTLWTWGANWNGRLGNGTTNIDYSSPVQVGSLTNWKSVSCGYCLTASIKTDGTLWTWGRNRYGGLGNGSEDDYSSPIQVGSLTNWKQVSCGVYQLAAIKTDGTLWTCGYNNHGELGNGTTTNYSSPVQVGTLTNWKSVSCGYRMLAAVKTDGTLWTCGYNRYGTLGNGTTTNYSSPIQVGTLTNWKSVSCGYGNFGAITYPISSGYFPDTSSYNN